MNFRFLFVWAVLILLFGLIYTYIPDTKLKFTGTGSGSLLCCGSMEYIFLGIFHVCVLWKWV